MNNNPSPIACDMSSLSPEQREAHFTTSHSLFSKLLEIEEISNGYDFRFAAEPTNILELAQFVSIEKLCCPFLNFTIDVQAEGGPLCLRLTGREGVKAFIREEISSLLGNPIHWR